MEEQIRLRIYGKQRLRSTQLDTTTACKKNGQVRDKSQKSKKEIVVRIMEAAFVPPLHSAATPLGYTCWRMHEWVFSTVCICRKYSEPMGGTFHRPLRPRPVCRACQEAGHEATSLKPVLVGDRSLQLRLKETQGQ
jgi:hypothetical protein